MLQSGLALPNASVRPRTDYCFSQASYFLRLKVRSRTAYCPPETYTQQPYFALIKIGAEKERERERDRSRNLVSFFYMAGWLGPSVDSLRM